MTVAISSLPYSVVDRHGVQIVKREESLRPVSMGFEVSDCSLRYLDSFAHYGVHIVTHDLDYCNAVLLVTRTTDINKTTMLGDRNDIITRTQIARTQNNYILIDA